MASSERRVLTVDIVATLLPLQMLQATGAFDRPSILRLTAIPAPGDRTSTANAAEMHAGAGNLSDIGQPVSAGMRAYAQS